MDCSAASGDQMRQGTMRAYLGKELRREVSKSATFGFVPMKSNFRFALLYRDEGFETKTGKKL